MQTKENSSSVGIEQKDQNHSQGAPIILPYRKFRLKGIENHGGLRQETTGLLAAMRVSPTRDTSLEDLLQSSRGEDAHNHLLERDTQGTPVIPPYQKLRLKSVERRGDAVQQTTGGLAALRVSSQGDTPLEDLLPLLHKWKDLNYYSQMDTFDFSEMPEEPVQPLKEVKDGSARWKILVVLVAILVISLVGIGIFSAYLLRPVFLHYLHILLH
jgi:hypothetical protein